MINRNKYLKTFVNFNCYNLNTTILYHEYHLFHHQQDLFSYKGNNIFIVRPLASYMAGRDVEFYSNDTCSLADSDICRIADTDASDDRVSMIS